MRRRAASKNEGPSCKVRKREITPRTSVSRETSRLTEVDLGNIRARLCSRFSSGAQSSPCVEQTDDADTSQKKYVLLPARCLPAGTVQISVFFRWQLHSSRESGHGHQGAPSRHCADGGVWLPVPLLRKRRRGGYRRDRPAPAADAIGELMLRKSQGPGGN